MSQKKAPEADENKWKQFAEQQETDEASEVADENAAEAGLSFTSHDELEQELNKKDMELAQFKDAAIRAKAEVENVRRRAERDVQNAHKYGSEKLLSDMLPVLDSLVRGLDGDVPTEPKTKAMYEGLALTLDLFEKTLAKHGMEVIDPAKGDAFNPEFHEAVTMQPDPEAASNTVLQVLQKGYQLNGRVLRAAMVIVAA